MLRILWSSRLRPLQLQSEIGRPADVSEPDSLPETPTRWCVTGHPIDDLDRQTEVVMMDSGANITVCRKHGAPIRLETTKSALRPALDR